MPVRNTRVVAILVALVLSSPLLPAPAPAVDAVAGSAVRESPYRIVVHAGNPVAQLTRAEAGKLFLKKTRVWSDGLPVEPVDLAESSAIRKAFSSEVVGKDVAAVRSYWQQQLFTGRGVPPVVKANDAEVVAFVASHPGAIGYVSAGAALPDGVKAVRIGG